MSLNTILKEMLDQIDDIQNLNIIEHEIDIEKQEEFLKFWDDHKIKESKNIDADIKGLLEEENNDKKKIVLFSLAASENPKAYRAIEKFSSTVEGEWVDWAKFALHESRMKMESAFSDENKIYLSTGLGGKSRKLRYFCVLPARESVELSTFQQEVVEKEVRFVFSNNDIELEEISLYTDFVSFVCLIPISGTTQNIFKSIIDECNNLGNFMDESFVLSNVKRLSEDEVRKMLLEDEVDDYLELEGLDENEDEI